MVETRETFVVTRAARLVLGVAFAAGLGATVVASPIRGIPGSATAEKSAAISVAFRPLGDGPAVAIQKSFGRHDEDCVTVTQVKGADGRIYATRGMVCTD